MTTEKIRPESNNSNSRPDKKKFDTIGWTRNFVQNELKNPNLVEGVEDVIQGIREIKKTWGPENARKLLESIMKTLPLLQHQKNSKNTPRAEALLKNFYLELAQETSAEKEFLKTTLPSLEKKQTRYSEVNPNEEYIASRVQSINALLLEECAHAKNPNDLIKTKKAISATIEMNTDDPAIVIKIIARLKEKWDKRKVPLLKSQEVKATILAQKFLEQTLEKYEAKFTPQEQFEK